MAASPKETTEVTTQVNKKITPLNCFSGGLFSGTLAILMYRMMVSIGTVFANKPVVSDNITVLKISVAVRTLVVGMVALGAGVFGLAAVGLCGLGLQLLIQKITSSQSAAEGE